MARHLRKGRAARKRRQITAALRALGFNLAMVAATKLAHEAEGK